MALFRPKGGLPIEEGPFYNDKLTDCHKTVCFSFHPNLQAASQGGGAAGGKEAWEHAKKP